LSLKIHNLVLGEAYDRPFLAELWGYESYHALARGVITPQKDNKIILFITKEKQEGFTPYINHFEGDDLFIEGEKNHSSDNRIVSAKEVGDEIHLFFREIHHQPFVYYGLIELLEYELLSDKPSKLRFITSRSETIAGNSLTTEKFTHGELDEEFTPDPEGKKRLAKYYKYERSAKNRARAIQIHGTKCLACGFDFNKIYGNELARDYIEIHHTKSITEIDETFNPETGLIPLCSNCHSMAHRKKDIVSLEELRKILRKT